MRPGGQDAGSGAITAGEVTAQAGLDALPSAPRPDPAALTKAIVLAGVYDWGGCALDAAMPRPLLPVANRPLVAYALDWLARSGLPEICICTNRDSRYLREHLDLDPSLKSRLDYYQDVMPRGPAGCTLDAWCDSTCETILLIEGTIIPRFDASALLSGHRRSGALLTIVVGPEGDHGGRSDYSIPAGVYVFERRALGAIPLTGYCDIKETLVPALYKAGERIVTYKAETPVPRVTGVESYMAVCEWVLECLGHARSPLPETTWRPGGAAVHKSARIDDSVRWIGPVVVGPDSIVEKDALLIGPVSIGSGTRVGTGSVVSRSVIWEDVEIGPGAVIDRCVLTTGRKVGSRRRHREAVLSSGRHTRTRVTGV